MFKPDINPSVPKSGSIVSSNTKFKIAFVQSFISSEIFLFLVHLLCQVHLVLNLSIVFFHLRVERNEFTQTRVLQLFQALFSIVVSFEIRRDFVFLSQLKVSELIVVLEQSSNVLSVRSDLLQLHGHNVSVLFNSDDSLLQDVPILEEVLNVHILPVPV